MGRLDRSVAAFALVVASVTSGVASGQAPARPAPAKPETVPAVPAVPLAPTGAQAAGDHAQVEKKPVYDETADTKQQIAAALAKAKRDHQRVLVQWGGNWCSWCLLLHKKMTSDATLARELLYEYQVVHADAGGADQKNIALALSYGADLKSFGFPFLTILDPDGLDPVGKPIANQETSALELKGENGESLLGAKAGHDGALVLAFLKEHEAPHLQAAEVLKAGMAEAAKSGRKLFVHVGAPTCGWCHKLEDWLAGDEIAPVFAKDYVDVKIDQDRMVGAAQVTKQLAMPENSGIPWFAIIDPATGKTLADSMVANLSIGYPAKDDEIAHFMGMVESTRKNLAAADLEKLKESLVAAARKLDTPHQ
jgi:thioredoxin-related protein